MQSPKSFPTLTDIAAYSLVKDRLALVEEQIGSLLEDDLEIVREIARYLHNNGGKRLRPALVLLCARLLGYKGDKDVELGVIVEFIHTATLVHDDIIDGASVRRGKAPANRIWGNQIAVLLGDFLYARSLAMSVAIGNLRIVEVLTHATSRLVEGEILDVVHNRDGDLDVDGYMRIVDSKTASLFAGCAQSAAVLAGAPGEQEAALASFGHNLGLAFQVVDDLLDYHADAARLGKQPGTDLREGKVTLPLIHFLERASSDHCELVLGCLGHPQRATEHLAEIVAAMVACDSFEVTRQAAERHALMARDALTVLPKNEVLDSLAELPEYIISRQH